jgi:hypothetical protein
VVAAGAAAVEDAPVVDEVAVVVDVVAVEVDVVAVEDAGDKGRNFE